MCVPEALVVVLLIIASGIALARWPRIGFLAAAFFLTLAPTSSVIPIASEVGAERRMYLPFAALATLAAVAGRWLVDRVAARMARHESHRRRGIERRRGGGRPDGDRAGRAGGSNRVPER